MRSGFTSLAIVGVAACVAVYATMNSTQPALGSSLYYTPISSDDMEFLKYVAKYGKSYQTRQEFKERADHFKATLAVLAEENSKNDNTFRLGLNKFADWSAEEYKSILNLKLDSSVPTTATEFIVRDIPSQVDWRGNNKVNAVKDQGICGSCWAFSAVASVESRWAIKSDTLLSFSEQQLVDCAKGDVYLNEGCNGGYASKAFDYVKDEGIMLEADYPYTAKDGECMWVKEKATVKNTGQVAVATNNPLALKTAIVEGPVSVSIEASSFVFQFYQGGILNSNKCGTNLNHAVNVVGYGKDATSNMEYYILRNSWGVSWGVGGYAKIAIVDGEGICGIQIRPVYPTFD